MAKDDAPPVASPAPAHASPPGYIRLRVLAQASAGPGSELVPHGPELVQQVDVLESWIRQTLRANPRRLHVLTAHGHSMPGVAEDGDLLFVEPCTEFQADGVYVLAVGSLIRVKKLRLRLVDRLLSIESTDGSAPELVPLTDVGQSLHVQGRVVGAWALRRY